MHFRGYKLLQQSQLFLLRSVHIMYKMCTSKCMNNVHSGLPEIVDFCVELSNPMPWCTSKRDPGADLSKPIYWTHIVRTLHINVLHIFSTYYTSHITCSHIAHVVNSTIHDCIQINASENLNDTVVSFLKSIFARLSKSLSLSLSWIWTQNQPVQIFNTGFNAISHHS